MGRCLQQAIHSRSLFRQATVQLSDPDNNLIGTATAAAAGQEVVLQTAPAGKAGTYTVTIQGANATTGGFEARLILNAALESEAHGGSSDDTLATAQDLSPTAVPLTGVADRLAVLGNLGGGDYSLVVTRSAD